MSAILGGAGNSKPYISTLPQPELEKLGLKAVTAGANPQKLQQAFATAQIKGDWTELESLISEKLGASAVQDPNPFSSALNLVATGGSATKPVSGSGTGTYSEISTGVAGAQSGLVDRLSKVWYGDPEKDPITQQNMVTRFVHEFSLQKEALALQTQANSVIKTINSFLGEGEGSGPTSAAASVSNNVDKVDVSESVVGGGEGSWTDIFTSLPQTIGTLAVSAIKFVTPKAPNQAQDKVDSVSSSSSSSVSVVKPLIDLSDPSTVTLGVLGTAALGTVAYAFLTSGESAEATNRIDEQEYYQPESEHYQPETEYYQPETNYYQPPEASYYQPQQELYSTSNDQVYRYKRNALNFYDWWNRNGQYVEQGKRFVHIFPNFNDIGPRIIKPFCKMIFFFCPRKFANLVGAKLFCTSSFAKKKSRSTLTTN